MKRIAALGMVLLGMNALAHAGTPALPSIPATIYNATNFGAVGDAVSDNTTAIQNTINTASAAGGGIVEIPAGIYLSGPLTLTSKINLQVDGGAVLKMLPLSLFTNYPAQNQAYGNLLYAKNASDIAISGSGTIDGQGANWWTTSGSVFNNRPYMVFFNGGCHRVLIENVTLQNPPKMHIVFKGSDDNITIQGITINTTAANAANTDGIDLVGASCLVQNCTINAGDDNIALGSSTSSAVSSDILITNCAFGVGHGVSIGSNTAGGVSNLTMVACTFDGTDYGIRMKSNDATSGGSGQGGVAQNLSYCNITMTNILHGAIVIYSYYGSGGIYGTPTTVTPFIASTQSVGSVLFPIWRNITISNVTASVNSGGIAGIIWGRKEVPVTNITFSSVNISASSSFDLYNAQGVQFIDSQITVPGTTNALNLYNAQVTLSNTSAGTNPMTLGGLATPPTNNLLAFFNANAVISDTNLLGTGSITLDNSSLAFQQGSVTFSNNLFVANASTLSTSSGSNSFRGALSGSGTLTLNLAGTSVLTVQSDSSAFGGSLTVGSGTLLVNNTTGSGTGLGAVTVADGATLGGNGILGGPLTVNGFLAPGNNGIGTLTISNNLVLNSGATLQYALGTTSDRTAVSGNLTFDGTLNVTDAGGFAAGTYTLFSYGGTLTDNGLTIGATPSSNFVYAVSTSTPGQVNLIVAVPPPVADFSGSPTNGVVPLTVTFTDNSSGTITNRFWDFGDGSTTNTAATSLSHTYSTAGNYTVLLTVSGEGGTRTRTRFHYVLGLNPAHLAVDPGSLNYGLVTLGQTRSLNFSVINSGDVPLSGTAASAAPFGVTSGGSYTLAAGQTQAVTVAFAPGASGTFNGSVIFSSDGGDSTNSVSGVGLTLGNIGVAPAVLDFGTQVAGTTVQASFVVTNTGGTVVSNGTAAVNGGPFTILSGATFSVAGFGTTNVVVRFAPVSAGGFTNSVVFATANGGTASSTVEGAGAIVPVAAFSGSPTNGVVPLAVTFTDSSSGTITNRFWDFGDGATLNTTGTQPVHTYGTAGIYTVSLTAGGPVGNDTRTRINYVVACAYTLSAINVSFGMLGGSNSMTVTTSSSACGWTAISNNSWIQIVGGSINTTGSAVVGYTVLPNTGGSATRIGTMTIAGQTFTVIQAGDTVSPTVVLTAPASGLVSNTIAVSATATDNVAVVKVEFYRDGGVLLGTVTTPPYNLNFNTATVGDGSHYFYAKAYDPANNAGWSPTNCVTVNNQAPSVPSGLAATAVSSNEVDLSWGASEDGGVGLAGYKVFRDGTQIATALGTAYSDKQLASGTEYCYEVAAYDTLGHVSAPSAPACARTFVPLGTLLGTYTGLVVLTNAPTHANSGSIKVVVGKGGKFAANLSLGGLSSAFQGQFDDAGNWVNAVLRKGQIPVQVILHLDVAEGTEQITGTVSNDKFRSELIADRAVYSRTNPCPWAGNYTVVLVSPEGTNTDIPQGFGYGTLTVTATGAGKLSGVLADGTKVKGSAPVSRYGTWPLYELLYQNHGACLGWMILGTNGTVEATVDWFRPPMPSSIYFPDGFTTNVTLIGERYVSILNGGPNPAGQRVITLGGGNLVSNIVKDALVDAAGGVTITSGNSEGLQLQIQPTTGQFSGSFTHPLLNTTISFKGVILQLDGAGGGYFLGTNESGFVVFEPTP